MPTLVGVLVSIFISLVSFIVLAALLEAGRRRGFDPVASIARVLSPDTGPAPVDPLGADIEG